MQIPLKIQDVVEDVTNDKKLNKEGVDGGTEDDSKENTEDTSLEDVKKFEMKEVHTSKKDAKIVK